MHVRNLRNGCFANVSGVLLRCLLARHFIRCLVLVIPSKTGNHPNMTEKLLSGMLSIKIYKIDIRGRKYCEHINLFNGRTLVKSA